MSTHAHPSAGSRRAGAARVAAALRTERGLARLGLGLAALHVADDNFLQPQPGTSAGDHLFYYEAAKGQKELWSAPGGHIDAINVDPQEYERRVVGILRPNAAEGAVIGLA